MSHEMAEYTINTFIVSLSHFMGLTLVLEVIYNLLCFMVPTQSDPQFMSHTTPTTLDEHKIITENRKKTLIP